jgi:GT2 family glycosyltransferase
MTTPQVSVIIINYNAGAHRLKACLASLDAQSFQNFEVIVLDNASEDGSEAVADAADGVRLIRSPENLGFAGGVNLAATHAKGRWLALLNPDATAAPDWLERFIEGTQSYPACRCFGSVQIDAANHDRLDGLGDCYHAIGVAWRGDFGKPASNIPNEDKAIFAPCGAAALYDKALFEELGGFAEDFFCYHEDVDFGARLHLAGEDVILLHRSVIYHEGSGTTGRYSDFTVYHGNRNRIRTFIRTMPGLLFWPLLPVHILVNLAFLARATMIGTGKPCFRAMKDGFFNSPYSWQQRRELQKARKATTAGFAQSLSWSPLRLLKRAADMRDITKR